jgi:hypothetical protein
LSFLLRLYRLEPTGTNTKPTPPLQISILEDRLQEQLRLVVAERLGQVAPQLAQRGGDLLHNVGVDLVDSVAALVLDRFQKAHGHRVVVHPSARLQGRYDHRGLRYGVVPQQVVHPLADVPTVDIFAVEEALVPARQRMG